MSFGTPSKVEVKYDAKEVQSMLDLLKAAPFPDKAPIDAEPWKLGIDYDYLKDLKAQFESKWKWESLEKRITRYDNFLVHYDNGVDSLDLHYLYAKSTRPDAIPLILLHGWPGTSVTIIFLSFIHSLRRGLSATGTFFDFHKVIEPLANPPDASLPALVVSHACQLYLFTLDLASQIPCSRTVYPRIFPFYPSKARWVQPL